MNDDDIMNEIRQQEHEKTRALPDQLRRLATLVAELADQGYTVSIALVSSTSVNGPSVVPVAVYVQKDGRRYGPVATREEWKEERQRRHITDWIE